MGRQALLAVLCWLTFSETLGNTDKAVNSAVVNDNASAESAPRLYRNVPVGVYASAVPYASVSYRLPAFLSGPVASASRVIPVKENVVFNNANGYLKDSYGNRFVGSPQSAAYKTTIPQQFVQLQALPAHLAQPLAVAAPSYQIRQAAPQIVFGSSYRLPSGQAAAPTPLNHFAGASQPFTYAQNIRSFAPSVVHSHFQRLTAPQQQSTSNKAVYTQFADKYKNFYSEPKFQRLEEKPNPTRQVIIENNISQFKEEPVQDEHANLKASPDTQSYTTIVNGKKTVIELDTKPPVPLLDLTLLEPLTFDNPVVPQVQHFLPKIHQATYQKLPEFTKQQKNNNSQSKKAKPKKKQKKPVQNDGVYHNQPDEPTITLTGDPNGPEIAYEINSPNYKETYKEQSLSYNKETTKRPVTFSYNHKDEKEPVNYSYGNIVQKEPVHYSYVHDSRHPGQTKEAYYSDKPKHLVYTFTPEQQQDEDSDGPVHAQRQSESGEVGSAEVPDDKSHQLQNAEYNENHKDSPRHKEHRVENQEHHQEVSSHKSHQPQRIEYQEKHEDAPRHKSHKPHHVEYHQSPKHNVHHQVKQHHGEPPRLNTHQPQRDDSHQHHGEPPRHNTHHPQRDDSHQHHGELPRHKTHPPQRNNHHQHHEETPRHNTLQPQRDHYHKHHGETPRHDTHSSQRDHHPQQHGETLRLTHHPQRAKHNEHHETRQKSHQPQHIEYQEHRQYDAPAPRHKDHQPHRIEYQTQHDDAPRHKEHPRPEHHEGHDGHHNANAPNRLPQQHSQSLEVPARELVLQPITQEFEEDIRLLPTHSPNAAIQVDPNQHVQPQQNVEPNPSPAPHNQHQEYQQEDQPDNSELPHPRPLLPGAQPIIHETSKRIIIQEETPDEMHSHQEQLLAEMMEQEENNEQDFEKAYKNAAFGFPGFNKSPEDTEKDIYNPNSYGLPRNNGYNVNHAAFQGYQAEGDNFPKSSRLRYKDISDGTKNDYYEDYLNHRPETFEDRSKKKQEYYKLYDSYKPEKYFADEKKEKQKEKYTLAPTFSFGSEQPENEEKKKGYFAQYKAAPAKYEYSYTKSKPRDNSAFASRPYQRFSKTHFVEPQFQYGFEPIALPRLLDSELATMASNNSPESEKPGMRKKIYKENWYIKKTSTAGGDAAS